jgi:hypothetical protein
MLPHLAVVYFYPNDLFGKKLLSLRELSKKLIIAVYSFLPHRSFARRACTFSAARSAGEMSASVCVRRASEASGRLYNQYSYPSIGSIFTNKLGEEPSKEKL